LELTTQLVPALDPARTVVKRASLHFRSAAGPFSMRSVRGGDAPSAPGVGSGDAVGGMHQAVGEAADILRAQHEDQVAG